MSRQQIIGASISGNIIACGSVTPALSADLSNTTTVLVQQVFDAPTVEVGRSRVWLLTTRTGRTGNRRIIFADRKCT